MNIEKNKAKFIKISLLISGAWLILGEAICWLLHGDTLLYFWVVLTATLGILILARIIDLMILSELPLAIRVTQFVLFSFFKLVCLSFLAITLKRFQVLSYLPVFLGASVYWVAPLIAGLLCSKE